MSKVWREYKELVIILAYLVFLVLIFKFLALPLDSTVREKRREVEKKMIDHEVLEKRIKEIPIIREKIDAVIKLESKLNIFISREDILSLIQKIEKIAEDTGNEIIIEVIDDGKEKVGKRIVKGEEKKEGEINNDLPGDKYIITRLTLTGDFNSILRFMHKLENLEYFSDIISVKLGKKEKEESIAVSVATRIVPVENMPEGISQDPIQNEEVSKFKLPEYENPMEAVFDTVFYLRN